MKKTFKRVLALIIAVMMVVSTSVVSFAADERGVLKAFNSLSKDDFHADKYKGTINRIYFLDAISAFPDNVTYIGEFDLSENADGSVIGRITYEIDGNDLYIAADGGVIANEDSSYLFADTGVREIIGFENFDTAGVKKMKAMFMGTRLESFDFSVLDTSDVIDMSLMFKNSYQLKKIYGAADTLRVSDMTYMFNDCSALEEFDAAVSFESIHSSGIEYMFKDCRNLKKVDFSKCTYTHNISSVDAFQNCKSLEEVNFSKWDFSSVADFSTVFTGCYALKNIYLHDVIDLEVTCSSSKPNNGVSGVSVHTNNPDFMSTNLWSYFSRMDDVYVIYDGIETNDFVNINFARNSESGYYLVNGEEIYAGSSWEYPVGDTLKIKLRDAQVGAYNINGYKVMADGNGEITVYLDSSAEKTENSYVLAEGEKVINIAPQTLYNDEPFPESTFAKALLTLKNFFIEMFNFFNATFNKAFQGIKWPEIFK